MSKTIFNHFFVESSFYRIFFIIFEGENPIIISKHNYKPNKHFEGSDNNQLNYCLFCKTQLE